MSWQVMLLCITKIYSQLTLTMRTFRNWQGFGYCGLPEHLIRGIVQQKTKNITAICLAAGTDDWGNGVLVTKKQIKRLITSYVGDHEELVKQFYGGTLEIELTPMGSIAEGVRAGGAGIPAFFTPCGVGTTVEEGGIPIRYSPESKSMKVAETSHPLVKQTFNGREYVLKTAITGDFGIAKAWKADPAGNLIFRKTARNINPSVLMASRVGVVEVEEIVPVGSLDPNFVHVPGIYVDRILLGDNFEKQIEKRTVRDPNKKKTSRDDLRSRIAQRVALEFRDGMYVNLGIGIPCQATEYIPEGMNVTLHGENGILGLGPHPTEEEVDPDMINPSKELGTYLKGSAFSDSQETFALIRGGHLDMTVLGSMQVSQYGDLANWNIPGQLIKGMGGAMDLVSAPGTKVIVAMEHNSKSGAPKILADCNLPLTGKRAVHKIITEKCVFNIDQDEGLILAEIAKDQTLETIKAATGCNFKVSENLRTMLQ